MMRTRCTLFCASVTEPEKGELRIDDLAIDGSRSLHCRSSTMTMHTTTLVAMAVAMLGAAAPAWADFKLERRLALEPGGTFTLETDIGSVTVVGDSTSGATVTLTSGSDDFEKRFEVRVEEGAGSARVVVKRRGNAISNLFRGWSDNTRFAIHVPQRTSVSVSTSGGSIDASRLEGKLGVHTSGGGLRVEDVRGNVDAGTSGGSIRMRGVRGDVVAGTSGGGIEITTVEGSLRAETSGGSIRIADVSGDLTAITSGGGVDIRGAGGRVEAESSGGSVNVAFVSGNARGGVLSTSGGGIRAEVDPSVALSIDASASGGGVNSDLPVTVRGRISRDALRGDLNGGGALLRLSTSGGGVRIAGVSAANR
jgi:hypothetical protein